jgi:Papain-like cysteine protease AvrRpt2
VPILDNFSIGTQGNSGNLCWAAVGLGIASYYDRLSNSQPRWTTLCDFVNTIFNKHDGTPIEDLRCCEDQRILQSDCNQPFDLPDALDVTGNHGDSPSAPLKFSQIKGQIDLKCPIGVEILTSAGNHFIVLFGYDDTDGQRVMVGDPAPDASLSSFMLYDEVVNNYRQAGGRWTQTYCTVAGNS